MTDTADTIDTAVDAERAPGGATRTRQCGRCRLTFPVPADTHPMELSDWWACPTCVETLVPGRRRARSTRLGQRGGRS